MANPWFRMYAEFVNDPKVQMLSESDQRRYIMILCLRCSNDYVTLQDDAVAFQLRISNEEWARSKAIFVEKGLVSEDNSPVAWNVRQFISDTSNDRVKRLRQRRKDAGLKSQSNISKALRAKVLEKCGVACVYCSSSDDLTVDHMTPVERGGSEEIDNLQIACRSCNADKRNMTHEEYMAWNGRVTLQKRPQNTDSDTDIEVDKSTSVTDKSMTSVSSGASSKPSCPAEEIVAMYHELMPNNPQVRVLNKARRGAIRARWKEASLLTCQPFGYSNREDGMKAWRTFFEVCNESAFLTGQVAGQAGKPPFVADIDFLMSPNGFAKCLENKYHREVA
jgi:5-methylcytosine-specific restriction endonuclease McrA